MAGERMAHPRDTAAGWTAANPVLLAGEIGIEHDTGQIKIGNGANAWNALPYFGPVPGEQTSVLFNGQSSPPSTPAAGKISVFAMREAARECLGVRRDTGQMFCLQPNLFATQAGLWLPPGNATTVPAVTGYTAHTAVGTATARNIALSSHFARQRRLGYVSGGAAGSLLSLRMGVAQIALGAGGLGGFFKAIRFGCSDAAAVAGARQFVGVSSSTSAPTNVEPNTLTNSIGVGHGAADTNLFMYFGGSAAQTPINLGANFPANTLSADVYTLFLWAPHDEAATVHYEVRRENTAFAATGTLTGAAGVALPANTTLLNAIWAYRTNNATALAVGLDLMFDYVEFEG